MRETEAWALSDGDCLREAFGATASDGDMGVPRRAREVEHVTDPKQALYQAFLSAHGGGGRRRRQAPNFLESIGERISLERLALVPAFARLREDLIATLKSLRYLE